MLKVNGQKLNLEDDKNPYVQEVKRGYEYLRSIFKKFPIMLVYPPSLIKPDPDNPGKKIVPAGKHFELKTFVNGPNGSEEWVWCQTEKRDKNNNVENIPKRFEFKGRIGLKENEIDKLFFLAFKCPYCGNGFKEVKTRGGEYNYVRTTGKAGSIAFIIEDKESDARASVNKKKMVAETQFAIYSENSPHSIEDLRYIAKAFGVVDTDELSDNLLKEALWNQIEDDEQRSKDPVKGFEKFEKLAGTKDLTEKMALIRDAIDYKIIMLNKANNSWVWLVDGEQIGDVIIKSDPTKENHEKILCEHLDRNKDDFEFMKLAVEESKDKLVSDEDKKASEDDEDSSGNTSSDDDIIDDDDTSAEEIKPVNTVPAWHLRKEFIDDAGNLFCKGKFVRKVSVEEMAK